MDSLINRSAFGGMGDHGRSRRGLSVVRLVTLGLNRVWLRIARAERIGWPRLTQRRIHVWLRGWTA